MKLFVNIARIIIGVLFIFSGLIKANDPIGLSLKTQEFFEVWGWTALHDYTLALSVLMIAFEIIAGVAVLLGWQMRLFSWLLLLLIIFFTFLTGYALFSGKIKTCGCFGDCIPLTAKQSFMKDLLLLILILVVFAYRDKIKPLFNSKVSLLILLLTTIFSFGAQWYVLKYLPVKDCLGYKKGKNILQQMKVPAGAIPDSTVITFVYSKGGQKVEFTADSFPEDFDDTIYSFIKRYDKVVRKGNAEPPVKDFVLNTPSGNDTTQALLEQPGSLYLFFIKEPASFNQWQQDMVKVQSKAAENNVPFMIVTARPEKVQNELNAINNPAMVLGCDAVAVKTAARADAVLYLLKDGTVVNKWSNASLGKAF